MSNPTDPIRFSIPERPKNDTRKKLGRGLGALMGETRREEPLVVNREDEDPARSGQRGALRHAGDSTRRRSRNWRSRSRNAV